MSFIELHSKSNKNKISYNINHIMKFYEPEEKIGYLKNLFLKEALSLTL